MSNTPSASTLGEEMTLKMVIEYLKSHPNFLLEHPDLLEILTPPEQKLGENVLDFQYYAIDNLKRGMNSLKDRFHGLVTSARANMSTQSQVHKSIISIVRARDLAHLMEVLTIDLATDFGVDVVRLVIESEMPELYSTYHREQNDSGISFMPTGFVEQIFTPTQDVHLIADSVNAPPYAYEEIFAECVNIVRSCAVLRLDLEEQGREGILAFGSRKEGYYHPSQGTDLLKFFAQVLSYKLDQCLSKSEIEQLV